MTGVDLFKGDGTRNDFVLLDDRDGHLDVTDAFVQAVTDRRSGIGGDGLIRLVRTSAMPVAERAGLLGDPQWFMDYRNADGSIAQMCGNGARVFAAFIEHLGLADCAAAPIAIGTRAGTKWVEKDPQSLWYTVSMGPGRLVEPTAAREQGNDSSVSARGLDGGDRPALSIDMGNPHTVVALASRDELDQLDLSHMPTVSPTPVNGTNVEFVVPISEEMRGGQRIGRAIMRVHERGVGETPSCGTGACAVALALSTWGGPTAPDQWLIDVPGGQVRVDLSDSDNITLSGPAAITMRAQILTGQQLMTQIYPG